MEFEDRQYVKKPETKDQFSCMEFNRCGRVELLKFFANLSRLSLEYVSYVNK